MVKTISPEVRDRSSWKEIIEEDEDFRKSSLGDEKVFRRVMDDGEMSLKISPALYFEILLRKTAGIWRSSAIPLKKTEP